jgi:CheY-like chemotaxis protein
MGGRIDVDSLVGRGSVFRVHLPLAIGAAPQAAPATPGAAREEPAPDIRILAAEDNEVNRLVLATLLGQAGLVPTLVDNGVKALAAWEAGEWDVILMDVQMPEMDGVSATRAIRQREAATGRARTPIIAVTANAMTHHLAQYAEAGMDDIVSKPLDATLLFAAIERALSSEVETAA